MQLALFDVSKKSGSTPKRPARGAELGARARSAGEGGALATAALDARVHAYTEAAHTQSTRRAYRADWDAFGKWCGEHGERAMPAAPVTLARYLAHLADGGKKASTIRRARIAIGLAHGWAGAERPDRDVSIRTVERGIARTHGSREEGAEALLAADLPTLVKAFRGGAHDDRDRALILLGFAGAFRASDLVGLDVEQLKFQGDAALRVLVARSKEDQEGKGAFVDIPCGQNPATCPVLAVRAWVRRVGRPAGPLFRVIRGTVIEHERMHVGAVSRAVQRAVARVGLEGDYSAHSLRAGLATSAIMAGTSRESIQRHGRWQDQRSLNRYVRLAPIYEVENPASGLL